MVPLVAIMFAALQLRNFATGWQEPPNGTEAADTPEPVADPAAEELVKAARERISGWKTIQANVVQRVDIGDRKLTATGRFLAGEFPKTRLEYELTVGQTVGTLREVCDGQVLHIERKIADVEEVDEKPSSPDRTAETDESSKPSITAVRRDVQRLLRATAENPDAGLAAHGADIGLGGLSALLASLDRSMVFDSLREEEHGGRSFRVVQGVWDPMYFAQLQTRLGGLGPQMAMYLPERVRIYFEAESLFPVRILYLKLASTDRRAYRALLSLEFHDVEFDAVLPSDAFSYRLPQGVQQQDDTDDFLRMLQATSGQTPAAQGAPGATSPEAPAGEPGTIQLRQPPAGRRVPM